MQLLQWILLLVGGGTLALVGLLFLLVRRAARKAAERAADLIGQGLTPLQAQEQLIADGVDPQVVVDAVRAGMERSAITVATVLLARGTTDEQVRQQLLSRGLPSGMVTAVVEELAHPPTLRRHLLVSLAVGLPLVALGGVVLIASLIVRDGNLTGRWVTFPFAGLLTRLAGTGILVFGLLFVLLPFKRTKWAGE